MRLHILRWLSVALLVLPLFAVPAGAIYVEGQAPSADTDVRILAASSGLADGSAPGTGNSAVSPGGLGTSVLPAGIGYPALQELKMPEVPAQYTHLQPLAQRKLEVPAILSPRSGYASDPEGFQVRMPAFKATRIFGQPKA